MWHFLMKNELKLKNKLVLKENCRILYGHGNYYSKDKLKFMDGNIFEASFELFYYKFA